ncbi:MAG: transposase [Prochloraceae cyanobacterium]
MILPAHNRGDLSTAQWKKIKPLLPPQKPAIGRPNNNHQTIINGILWVLRTGAPWRDIPDSYGPWLACLRTLLSLA